MAQNVWRGNIRKFLSEKAGKKKKAGATGASGARANH